MTEKLGEDQDGSRDGKGALWGALIVGFTFWGSLFAILYFCLTR